MITNRPKKYQGALQPEKKLLAAFLERNYRDLLPGGHWSKKNGCPDKLRAEARAWFLGKMPNPAFTFREVRAWLKLDANTERKIARAIRESLEYEKLAA